MRILVAGASGVIGRQLVPLLIGNGHEVFGITRDRHKARTIEAEGATPLIADCLDGEAVLRGAREASPDAIVHQLTDLSDLTGKNLKRELAGTARLRTIGTDNLLRAAADTGARHFLAQSYIGSGLPFARTGGMVKREAAPFDPNPAPELRESLAAIAYLERAIAGAPGVRGVVLRYGNLHGPGTAFAEGGGYRRAVLERKLPLIGGGPGVWSFTHVEDAARAAALALASPEQGVFNVVDDHPARVSEWLPLFAREIGARAPLRLPAFVGRLLAGRAVEIMMTQARGASNEKARSVLGWAPAHAWKRDLPE